MCNDVFEYVLQRFTAILAVFVFWNFFKDV